METTHSNNLPIAYDFHGDVPLTTPFREIRKDQIHIYLDLDTRVGKKTCGQSCSHCWFVNYEKAHAKTIEMNEGRAIKGDLDRQGYKVFARYTDSFALGGDFMRNFGPVHNREFRMGDDHIPTETMVKGDAWTSGAPLMQDNWRELLQLAVDSGYGTVSITFHGIVGDDLTLLPHSGYPLTGVFSGHDFLTVASRIAKFNHELNQNSNKLSGDYQTTQSLRLNVGITIGRHNNSATSLYRYAEFFNRLNVATVRFNCFTDHGGRHPNLQMSKAEIAQTYKLIKELHTTKPLNFQLAVSEDFGTSGVEVMGFPDHVGVCRAGTQLFAVVPTDIRQLSSSGEFKVEAIGDIVACVNIFEPHFGTLNRYTNLSTGAIHYDLEFDHAAIDLFSKDRIAGIYKDGCFAKDILAMKRPALSKVALRAHQAILEKHKSTGEAHV